MTDAISQKNATAAMAAVDLLRQKNLQIATAESCTAGLLSAAITAVPGASAVFGCGVAAYAPEIKRDVLGVSSDILEKHGTVSSQTATAMADGVRRMCGAHIGVAITGVAGPAPSENKPVGTVHIALAGEDRVWLQQLEPQERMTERETIRQVAVNTALSMVQKYAEAYPAMVAGSMPLTPPQPTEVVIPETPAIHQRRFLATILPWKGDTLKERLLKVSIILIACALIVGGAVGIHRLISQTGNKSLYSDLQNMYTDEQEIISDNTGMLQRFSSLYLQNADIGGWVRINGTSISYPVMKNAGSDYYADHNFRQQASSYGVPYFDSHNSLVSPHEKNKTLIIYGNNTGDGQMFSELTSYRDTDFFEQHMLVEMSTLYASDSWLLFGVLVLDPEEINAFEYAQTSFENDQAFLQYIADIRKRSLVNTNVDINADDELLLLVTQAEEEYGFDNATMVVVGRRLKDGEVPPDADSLQVTRNRTVLMPRIWARMHHDVSTTRRTAATTGTQTQPLTSTTGNGSVGTTVSDHITTAKTTHSTAKSTKDEDTGSTDDKRTTDPTSSLSTDPTENDNTTITTSSTQQDENTVDDR